MRGKRYVSIFVNTESCMCNIQATLVSNCPNTPTQFQHLPIHPTFNNISNTYNINNLDYNPPSYTSSLIISNT